MKFLHSIEQQLASVRRLILIAVCMAPLHAFADDAPIGHVSATVVDTKTVSDCDPGDPEGDCLPVVPVPDCPVGQSALDCIPVE